MDLQTPAVNTVKYQRNEEDGSVSRITQHVDVIEDQQAEAKNLTIQLADSILSGAADSDKIDASVNVLAQLTGQPSEAIASSVATFVSATQDLFKALGIPGF